MKAELSKQGKLVTGIDLITETLEDEKALARMRTRGLTYRRYLLADPSSTDRREHLELDDIKWTLVVGKGAVAKQKPAPRTKPVTVFWSGH